MFIYFFKKFLLLAALLNIINIAFSQNDENGNCGQPYKYEGRPGYKKALIFNIPPGQQKGVKVYEYFANHYIVPDGLEIYIDGVLIDTIWVGDWDGQGNVCSEHGSGKKEKECRIGPVEWSNEKNPNGSGELTNLYPKLSVNDIYNLFYKNDIIADPIYGYKGLLHIKLYTTENICQIKFVINSSYANDTAWVSQLNCPSLSCPTTLPIKAEESCDTVKLRTDVCQNFRNNLKWSGVNGSLTGGEVEFAKEPGRTNSVFTLDATFSNQCSIHQTVNTNYSELIHADTQSTPASCSNVKDGSAIVTSIAGGKAPYKIEWNNQDATTINNALLTGLASGTYKVKITDADGCGIEKTITVQEGRPIKLDLTQENVLCYGDHSGKITSNASSDRGALTYSWSTGSKDKDLTNLPVGSYTVTVRDDKGCSTTKTATLTQPNTPLKVDFETFGTTCDDSESGKIELKIEGGTQPYRSNFDGIAAGDKIIFDELVEGKHDVIVTDNNGCTQTLSPVVPYDPATLEGKITSDGCSVSAELELRNSLNGIIPGSKKIIKNVKLDNKNTAHLRLDFKGCSFEDDFQLVGPRPALASEIHFPNVFSPNGDNVNDVFSFKTEKLTIVKAFRIFDRWGEMVYSDDNIGEVSGDSYYEQGGGWDGTFRGNKLNPGVYVYHLELPCGDIKGDVTLIR